MAIEKYAWRNGPPTTILCDNGSSFTSIAAQRFKTLLGLNIRCTSSYNPQSNGVAERANRFLKDCLAAIGVHYHLKAPEEELHWSNYVDYIAFVHNCSVNPSTGLAPWIIRNGTAVPDISLIDWNTYGDLLVDDRGNIVIGAKLSHHAAKRKSIISKRVNRLARKNINIDVNKKYQAYLKQAKNKPYHNIKIGDQIDLKESRLIGKPGTGRTSKGKLRHKWRGPYTVLSVNSSGTAFEVARLKNETQSKTFWVNVRLVRRTTAKKQTNPIHL